MSVSQKRRVGGRNVERRSGYAGTARISLVAKLRSGPDDCKTGEGNTFLRAGASPDFQQINARFQPYWLVEI